MIGEEVKKWLVKAINDYKTAEKLLGFPPEEIITDTLCFHCQQFVEKALKAFLVHKNVDFEKVHSLEYLVKLCIEQDQSFKWLYEVAKELSDYAIEIRYPDEFYIPTLEEARKSFDIATRVKDFIFEKIGVKQDDLK